MADDIDIEVCWKCGGAGRIDCPECGGKGCNECGLDSGWIVCPECFGKGEVEVYRPKGKRRWSL